MQTMNIKQHLKITYDKKIEETFIHVKEVSYLCM